MPDKISIDNKFIPSAQEFFGGSLPPEQISKFLNYLKEEEKTFEAMPRWQLLGMLRDVAADINARLSYDEVEKLAISAQKKSGWEPYNKFSDVKEDPAQHIKTPFEKFEDYCHAYQYKADGYGYGCKPPVDFRTFSLLHQSDKGVGAKLGEFLDKNGQTDENAKIIRQVLEEFRRGLPAVYGEIFTQRLKREVIFLKIRETNEKAKMELVLKAAKAGVPFTKPKDPFEVSSSALNFRVNALKR